MSSPSSIALEKGLPANVDAERFVLGSILLDDSVFIEIAGALQAGDFCLDKHQRIFRRMAELHERGEKVDRITLANELLRYNELESVDGLSYLVSLVDGLPKIPNLDGYIRIIRDKAALRQMIAAAQQIMNRALLAEDTPEQILAGAEETLLKLGESRVTAGLMSPRDVIENYEGGINAFLDPSKRIKGISTGFTKLDEMTGGLHKGELIILAARPSMGKTALALNIAEHVAVREGLPVVDFSMEMGASQLALRMVGSLGRIDQQHLRTGALRDDEWGRLSEAVEKLGKVSLFIDESGSLSPSELRARARRQARQCGQLGLIVVDYLQLMSGSSESSEENRATVIGEISRALKSLAKELKCPVMALSQLNRSVESRTDKRPLMSDLRESGAIEQDADVIMFIYRDEYYTKDACKEPGIAEIIIGKQRNGPTDTFRLTFLKPLTKFDNLAPGSAGGDY